MVIFKLFLCRNLNKWSMSLETHCWSCSLLRPCPPAPHSPYFAILLVSSWQTCEVTAWAQPDLGAVGQDWGSAGYQELHFDKAVPLLAWIQTLPCTCFKRLLYEGSGSHWGHYPQVKEHCCRILKWWEIFQKLHLLVPILICLYYNLFGVFLNISFPTFVFIWHGFFCIAYSRRHWRTLIWGTQTLFIMFKERPVLGSFLRVRNAIIANRFMVFMHPRMLVRIRFKNREWRE